MIRVTLPSLGDAAARLAARELIRVARRVLAERFLLVGSVVAIAVAVTHPRPRHTANGAALELILAARHVLARATGSRVLVRLVGTIEISVAQEPLLDAGAAAATTELLDGVARRQLGSRDRARLVVFWIRLETLAA